jgi:hypothetical protein
MTRETRQQRLPLPLDPRGGAIGSAVVLKASGLPPDTNLLIAFANLQNYQLIQRVLTDSTGSFTATSQVPDWAILDGVHYFFASHSDEIPLALSAGFHVTAPDGTARVEGTIERPATGCVDLKNAGDVVYHLVGNVGNPQTGARVTVVGTITDPAVCNGIGPVIAVKEITSLPR